MQTDEALDALLRVEYVRRRTRDRLRGGWFPPGLFGALFLVSLGPAITSSRLLTAIYWAIAGPCAIATIALYYGRRQDQTGSRGLVGPEVVCAVGLWAAALLLAGVGGYATSLTLWWLYYPQVGWGLPVLGVVTLAPVGAHWRWWERIWSQRPSGGPSGPWPWGSCSRRCCSWSAPWR